MTLPHPSVTPDGADVLHNTSMLQMIPSLTDRNTAEFFSTLEWVGSLGNWSKPQMEEKSFSFDFGKFSSAHQMEQESVKDFSVRIEGLARRCLKNHLENGEDIFIPFNQQIASSSAASTPAVTNNSQTGVLPRSCPYDLRPRNANGFVY
ncbi:hypothetical protein AVEN_171058-1 [Araneus ventricosus]|uniref:Retrotransposon gag domain-containing protein n=1 Tax=Araneus ventricosus TaxID=182803 RepID=A0A4Y2LMX5_ARAVE|nr:hypothetical protein AVEN_171058-1 [Araneus ventricosus]